MIRRNQILTGILVLQLILGLVVLWPRSTASGGEGESLFPGVEASDIVALTLTDAGGERLQLAKHNGQWVLPEAGDYPCLEDKVPLLLDKLIQLKTDRLVTQTVASHKRLKVAGDEYQRLAEFELADGRHHRLYLGSSPSYGVSHVRADARDEVYLASDLSATDLAVQPSAWVEQAYLDVPPDQIVALTLENGQGRFEFVKEGESWTLKDLTAGETLDETSVKTLANKARYATLLRPLGKEEQASYGLDEPRAVVTIQTQGDGGDRTYTLWVGAQDPADNSFVVKSSDSDYYVRVSEYAVKDLVEKGREDFFSATSDPTPVPEVTAESTAEELP
ncbi:MAG: DUF4340 domain-containing protein [Anaerolineae bacterium]|jgi:hypothetical protein